MRFTLVRGDDWCGLYVDGILKFEGHSIRPEAIVEEYMGGTVVDADEEWLEKRGRLPAKLSHVKTAK